MVRFIMIALALLLTAAWACLGFAGDPGPAGPEQMGLYAVDRFYSACEQAELAIKRRLF